MIPLTYLLVALSTAYILEKRIVTASIFSLLPTFDTALKFAYPFTTNGILHSLPAAFICSFLIYSYSEDIESAESCFLGYFIHLLIDLTGSTDIPMFYPLLEGFSLGILPQQNVWWNAAFISAAVSAMFLKKNSGILQPVVNLR